MAYGHAERTLAAIQLLETQTAELLCRLPRLDAEQSSWLEESTEERRRAVTVPGGRPGGLGTGGDRFGRARGGRAVLCAAGRRHHPDHPGGGSGGLRLGQAVARGDVAGQSVLPFLQRGPGIGRVGGPAVVPGG